MQSRKESFPSRGLGWKDEEPLVYGWSQLTSHPDTPASISPLCHGHERARECGSSGSEAHSQEITSNLSLAACEGGLREGQDKTCWGGGGGGE